MMKKLSGLVLMGLVLVGCGGPAQPSIDHGKKLSALSESERQDMCAWAVSKMGGDGHKITCGSGDNKVTATFTIDHCLTTSADCSATYGDVVSCTEDQSNDFCGGKWVSNASCITLSYCGMAMDGSGGN
jgi:hypothetical protein